MLRVYERNKMMMMMIVLQHKLITHCVGKAKQSTTFGILWGCAAYSPLPPKSGDVIKCTVS